MNQSRLNRRGKKKRIVLEGVGIWLSHDRIRSIVQFRCYNLKKFPFEKKVRSWVKQVPSPSTMQTPAKVIDFDSSRFAYATTGRLSRLQLEIDMSKAVQAHWHKMEDSTVTCNLVYSKQCQ